MKDKDNDNIMSELQDIINKETKKLTPTNSKEEGLRIFNNLMEAFDNDMSSKTGELWIISHLDEEEMEEARARVSDDQIIDNGQTREENKGAQGGKVEMITDAVPHKDMVGFLGDLETALVLSQWKEPAGLIARTIRKGERIQAMCLGNVLIFQKVLITGDKVTKVWNTNKEEAPTRDDFGNSYDFNFLRNTYLHLMRPVMLKTESPTMYDEVMDMVKKNIKAKMEEGGGDDDDE